MGFVPGPARSKSRATLDVIVGAGELALGGAITGFVISKAPELYEMMQEFSYHPVLSTALPMAVIGAPAYLMARGAMRIKNLRYEPEHDEDYAHRGVMDWLREYVRTAATQPYGSAPSAQGTARA